MKEKNHPVILQIWPYLLVALIIYMPVFGHLGKLPLRIWDEARLASNALEMYHNGNYLVTYINGHEEMWNTKPPLLIWLQVLCFKVLGPSDMAARLPSALAAFATALYLMHICIKHFKSKVMAIASALVLITIPYYMSTHCARSADYDALLTLCIVVVSYSFYNYCQTHKLKYLYAFFGFLLIGVLTKSVAVLMILPAIGVFGLWDRQVLGLLKSKHFYFGLFALVGIVFAYYFAREQVNPGYWEAVKMNELGGRFGESLENHSGPFLYYFYFLVEEALGFWLYFLAPALLFGILRKDRSAQKILTYSLLMALSFFLIISSAGTKIRWYVIPVFPFCALFIGYFIRWMIDYMEKIFSSESSQRFSTVIKVFFLVLIFAFPLKTMYSKNYLPEDIGWRKEFYEIGRYLKDCIDGEEIPKGNTLVLEGYSIHNKFYLRLLQMQGKDIQFKRLENVLPGDKVIVYQSEVKSDLSTIFELILIGKKGEVETYEILNQKDL